MTHLRHARWVPSAESARESLTALGFQPSPNTNRRRRATPTQPTDAASPAA